MTRLLHVQGCARQWDATDRRIFGKIASCERRKTTFWPSVRLIAHDLRLSKSTVQDRLRRLEAQGAIVVSRFGKCQLCRRNTKMLPVYGHKRRNPDKPPFQGEGKPAAPLASACEQGIPPDIGGCVRPYRSKDPPEVQAMVGIALRAGLRTSLPLGIRDVEVAALCRDLYALGLNRQGLRYLVWRTRKAKSTGALLGHWLADPFKWKAVLGDRLMGWEAAQKNREALGQAEKRHCDDWLRDYPDLAMVKQPEHVGGLIGGVLEMARAGRQR